MRTTGTAHVSHSMQTHSRLAFMHTHTFMHSHSFILTSSQGLVYIKFMEETSAYEAQQVMHGRYFDGKLITIEYLRDEMYLSKFPESGGAHIPMTSDNVPFGHTMAHVGDSTTYSTYDGNVSEAYGVAVADVNADVNVNGGALLGDGPGALYANLPQAQAADVEVGSGGVNGVSEDEPSREGSQAEAQVQEQNQDMQEET